MISCLGESPVRRVNNNGRILSFTPYKFNFFDKVNTPTFRSWNTKPSTKKGKEGAEPKHAATRQTGKTQPRNTSVTWRQERRSGRQDPTERRPSSPLVYLSTTLFKSIAVKSQNEKMKQPW